MNLVARSKLSSAHLIFSSPSSKKRLLLPLAALHQCNSYSSKPQQSTKPRIHKSPSQSSTSFSQRIKKQSEALTDFRPRISAIPYQAKISNFVNLIGTVKTPVWFQTSSDGKHLATTVISHRNAGEKVSSLSIPVVFEGDLASVVARNVKERDCVFVSGHLSFDPIFSESVGRFHIVAENINLVEGGEMDILVSDNETVLLADEELDEGKVLSSSVVNSVKASTNGDAASTLERGSDESKLNEKSGESVCKKKVGDQDLDLWRDLVKNPQAWWDYREQKSKGLVKERFPDFKKKGTGESLWISTAPDWVLPGIERLVFDVRDSKPRQDQSVERPAGSKKNDKNDDSWKKLVEDPDKWWDNRTGKKNPKAPDFKHKETGEVIWVNRLPSWVLSKLPPTKEG